MIFVTVGGQLPFDRLVHAVDRWAEECSREDVFAQIGRSDDPPHFVKWERFLSPTDFRRRAEEASVIVAHAGMGSILTALELEKPIIVMPRRADLGEHRNDHQAATVRHLGDDVGIVVAPDEHTLLSHLQRVDDLPSPSEQQSVEYSRLLDFLGRAIQS